MKKLFLFASIVLFLVACSDDDNNNPVNVDIRQIPTEISYISDDESDPTKKDTTTTTYEYDSSHRLVKTSYRNGDYFDEEIFTYNGSDLVKVEEKYSGGSIVYSFQKPNNNRIGLTELHYDGSGNLIWDPYEWVITLDSNGLPTKVEQDGKSANYTTYKYDSNNNITEIRKYKEGDLYFVTTATYDNKRGFMSQVNTPVWAFVGMSGDDDDAISGYFNNPLGYTRMYTDDDNYALTYVYEYDQNNYPKKIVEKEDSEIDGTAIIKYKEY